MAFCGQEYTQSYLGWFLSKLAGEAIDENRDEVIRFICDELFPFGRCIKVYDADFIIDKLQNSEIYKDVEKILNKNHIYVNHKYNGFECIIDRRLNELQFLSELPDSLASIYISNIQQMTDLNLPINKLFENVYEVYAAIDDHFRGSCIPKQYRNPMRPLITNPACLKRILKYKARDSKRLCRRRQREHSDEIKTSADMFGLAGLDDRASGIDPYIPIYYKHSKSGVGNDYYETLLKFVNHHKLHLANDIARELNLNAP